MKKRMFLMLGGFVLFLLILAGVTYLNIQKGIAMGKLFAPPPVTVSTITVAEETWKPTLSTVGSLVAVNGVQVSTDQSGIVLNVPFESGAKVKAGDLLMELDTRQDVAQLHSAQAQLELSKTTLTRQEDLLGRKVSSQSDFDSAKAQNLQAVAAVEQVQALIDHKTVKAPFDGVLGIRQVNRGQYFSAGTPIVSLQSLDPIYVNFSLPQQAISAVKEGGVVRVYVDGMDKKGFEGQVNALESRVDAETRNIQVQATIRNDGGTLRPGMYAQVEVELPEKGQVLSVPSTAVNYAPYGNSVFVVAKMKDEKDGHEYEGAEERFVTLGQTRGDQVSVVSGLSKGDVVVSGGTFRLRAKTPLQINNSVQPENNAAPTPPNT